MACSLQVAGQLIPCGVIRHFPIEDPRGLDDFPHITGVVPARSLETKTHRLPKEARGMFLLFKGEDFVSYAGYGGATANTMRITGVFTPADCRGRGYGQLICWYVSWWTGAWLNELVESWKSISHRIG